MAVYDKIQRSLLGKCCLPSRGMALTQALQSISGEVLCEILPVESYTGYYPDWDKWGASPYLDTIDTDNRIGDDVPTCSTENDGMYHFKNTTFASISKCTLHIYVKRAYAATEAVTVFIHTTDPLISIGGHTFTVLNDEYEDKSWDITSLINTVELVNLCNARFYKATGTCFVMVAYAYLEVKP